MQRQMLVILSRLDGIAVRESVFAAELEIAVKHPITTDEFKREMDELLGTPGRVEQQAAAAVDL